MIAQGRWMAGAGLASLVAVISASHPHAQPRRDPVATGHRLTEQLCSRCHVVTPSGHGSWTDAPDFQAIANGPGASARALSAFIQKPHMHMLNTQRPPAEADAIAAYIMSLRDK